MKIEVFFGFEHFEFHIELGDVLFAESLKEPDLLAFGHLKAMDFILPHVDDMSCRSKAHSGLFLCD